MVDLIENPDEAYIRPIDDPGGDPPTDPPDPPGTPTPGGVPGHVLHEFYFDKTQNDSTLRCEFVVSASSNDDLQFIMYIGIDDSVVAQSVTNLILDTQTSRGVLTVLAKNYVGGIAAGSRKITFSIRNFEPDSALSILPGWNIEVMELKTPAK